MQDIIEKKKKQESKRANKQENKEAREQIGTAAITLEVIMMEQREMNFEEWQKTVPEAIRTEKFWLLIGYQKALYLYDLLWNDTQAWLRDARGQVLSRQIIGSADSVCSNIEEGYGRGYGKQFLQFYGYSLGSARETKGHLYRAKAFYTSDLLAGRIKLASEGVALLLTEINRQKAR